MNYVWLEQDGSTAGPVHVSVETAARWLAKRRSDLERACRLAQAERGSFGFEAWYGRALTEDELDALTQELSANGVSAAAVRRVRAASGKPWSAGS